MKNPPPPAPMTLPPRTPWDLAISYQRSRSPPLFNKPAVPVQVPLQERGPYLQPNVFDHVQRLGNPSVLLLCRLALLPQDLRGAALDAGIEDHGVGLELLHRLL